MESEKIIPFYANTMKTRIVVDDELLDLLAEEYQNRDENKFPDMTYLQWVEFRTWELSHMKI